MLSGNSTMYAKDIVGVDSEIVSRCAYRCRVSLVARRFTVSGEYIVISRDLGMCYLDVSALT